MIRIMKLTSINQKNLKTSIRFIFLIPVALLYRKVCPEIMIITERSDQARDNGLVFFKYMRENYPEKKIYYIIEKDSDDRKKIQAYGNLINFDGWKHYFYYCISKIHISSHVNGCWPTNAPICRRIKGLLGIKDVFIPHGVSYGVSEFCLKRYTGINLFICSGKPEYDNVLRNYGYKKDELAYTGFPRLDLWHNIQVNKRQILFMPTWRSYVAQDPNIKFKNTLFYKKYSEILNDKELITLLSDNDLTLIFYLHHEMRKYVDYFKTISKNILIAKDDEYDIQELLKTSALLITDYSSVHFDFAYMNKPVIYYQFDQTEFYDRQYQQTDFHAEEDGFGPVVYNEDNLVKAIQNIIKKSFSMEDCYYKRMREFYRLYDKQNCQRVYQVICKRLMECR